MEKTKVMCAMLFFRGNLFAHVYSVNFDAAGLPSGLYFYKLQVGEFSEMKKMLYLR